MGTCKPKSGSRAGDGLGEVVPGSLSSSSPAMSCSSSCVGLAPCIGSCCPSSRDAAPGTANRRGSGRARSFQLEKERGIVSTRERDGGHPRGGCRATDEQDSGHRLGTRKNHLGKEEIDCEICVCSILNRSVCNLGVQKSIDYSVDCVQCIYHRTSRTTSLAGRMAGRSGAAPPPATTDDRQTCALPRPQKRDLHTHTRRVQHASRADTVCTHAPSGPRCVSIT